MDNDILLWHVLFDIERPLIRTYVPLVPKNPMPGEDITIPRICFAPSIEDCLNAMVADRVERGLEDGRFMAFPFRVAKDDPFLKTPDDIGDMVPDAYWTREHWYLKPVTLAGYLMQVDDFEDYEFYDLQNPAGERCFLRGFGRVRWLEHDRSAHEHTDLAWLRNRSVAEHPSAPCVRVP